MIIHSSTVCGCRATDLESSGGCADASSFKDSPAKSKSSSRSASTMELVRAFCFSFSSSASPGAFKSLSSVSRESVTLGMVDDCRNEEPLGLRDPASNDVDESLDTRDKDELLGE